MKRQKNQQKTLLRKLKNAIKAERARLQGIQEISNGIDPELVQEAMFGETACNAAELALRAKQNEDEKQKQALTKLKSDAKESKVNEVSAEPGQIAADSLKEADEREAAVKKLREKISKEGK